MARRRPTAAQAAFLKAAWRYPDSPTLNPVAAEVCGDGAKRHYMLRRVADRLIEEGWLAIFPPIHQGLNLPADQVYTLAPTVRLYVTAKGAKVIGETANVELLSLVERLDAEFFEMHTWAQDALIAARYEARRDKRLLRAAPTMLSALRAVLDGGVELGDLREKIQAAVDLAEGVEP